MQKNQGALARGACRADAPESGTARAASRRAAQGGATNRGRKTFGVRREAQRHAAFTRARPDPHQRPAPPKALSPLRGVGSGRRSSARPTLDW